MLIIQPIAITQLDWQGLQNLATQHLNRDIIKELDRKGISTKDPFAPLEFLTRGSFSVSFAVISEVLDVSEFINETSLTLMIMQLPEVKLVVMTGSVRSFTWACQTLCLKNRSNKTRQIITEIFKVLNKSAFNYDGIYDENNLLRDMK
jgi:hypothetical protein